MCGTSFLAPVRPRRADSGLVSLAPQRFGSQVRSILFNLKCLTRLFRSTTDPEGVLPRAEGKLSSRPSGAAILVSMNQLRPLVHCRCLLLKSWRLGCAQFLAVVVNRKLHIVSGLCNATAGQNLLCT